MPGEHGVGEHGAGLIEVLVALALIGTVMTALTAFFVTATSVSGDQGARQAAAILTQEALDRVGALRGSSPAVGRDRPSSDSQWSSPVTGVSPWLADMRETWDPSATFPSGISAPLPTAPQPVTVNGIAYARHWYVGLCWQAVPGGPCGLAQVSGYVEFFRAVVAITWPSEHCAGSTCSSVASTLISASVGDPVLDAGPTTRPVVAQPGDQVGELTVPATLQLASSGGTPPVTWSSFGLPIGIAMDSSGLASGTPTVPGAYAVTVRAVDRTREVGTARFTWTISGLPSVANPGPQTTPGGGPVNLGLTASGGTSPLTWSVTAPGPWGATGLPPGLAIDPATGTIAGTPTAAGAGPVTAVVTDRFGKTARTTFTWTVPVLATATPGQQSCQAGLPVTPLRIVATGGIPPYSWSATGLPAGLSIDPVTGTITGTAAAPESATVIVTVTDAAGTASATAPFTWTVL